MMSVFASIKRSVRTWVLLLLIMSTALIAADVVFRLTVIDHQESRIGSMEERIDGLRGRSTGGSGKAGSPERAASGVAAFKKTLPERKAISKILGEIFGAARGNGLKIDSGDYKPETVKDTDISRYTFSFLLEGGYAQVKRFIYDLESSRYPVVIEDISLTGAKKGDAISLKMRVSIYFM